MFACHAARRSVALPIVATLLLSLVASTVSAKRRRPRPRRPPRRLLRPRPLLRLRPRPLPAARPTLRRRSRRSPPMLRRPAN